MASVHLTGASGYIGAALLQRLRADGHRVEVATYRLPSPPPEPIRADYLIHLAAAGGGTHHRKRAGGDDAGYIRAVNVGGMGTVLDALADATTRVLFLSSVSVYGRTIPALCVDESARPQPGDDYARGKAEAETILRARGVDHMILRASAMFGPAPDGRFGGSFLNVVVDGLLRDGVIHVQGGEQGIDALYLADLVDLVSRICQGEWHARETFNVAGEVVSVATMLGCLTDVAAAAGVPCVLRQHPWAARPDVLLDNGKLKRAFPGWRPTDLSRSLATLLQARRAATLPAPCRPPPASSQTGG